MPIESIRKVHNAVAGELTLGGENLGLAFDRLVSKVDNPGNKEHGIKDKVLEIFSGYKASSHPELKKSYTYAFNQWKNAIKTQNQTLSFDIVSLSKVIFGSGNASALEVGVHLNKPWGVPYISGSSIKGILASFLRKTGTLSLESLDYVNIFGGNYDGKKYSGSVVFNDAWLYPDCDSWFERDIINPHYQKYYSGERFPDGMESPIPVQTLTLSSGLSFFVSMQGPDNLLKYLKDVLEQAFFEIGAGAKTAVGYGRFRVLAADENRIAVENEIRQPKVNVDTTQAPKDLASPRPNAFPKKVEKITKFPITVVVPIVGQSKKGKWLVRVDGVGDSITILNSDAVPATIEIGSEIKVEVKSSVAAQYIP